MPLFVYGPTGGGKSGVLSHVLAALDVPRAIVDCVACATPRALYETCLNQLHDHRPCEANNYSSWCSCENPAQFVQGVPGSGSGSGVGVVGLRGRAAHWAP